MRISPLFLCLIIFGFCSGIGPELCLVFLVAFLHECGHMAVARLFKVKIRSVYIKAWGVCMETDSFPSARKECVTALAGPLVNLFLLGLQFFWQNEIFMVSNLFMFLLNILPVMPLDGGRIIHAILAEEIGKERTEKIMISLTGVLSVILFAVGSVLLWKTGVNFSVILIAVFIACSVSGKRQLDTVKFHNLQCAEHYFVLAENSAKTALRSGIKKERAVLDLVSENGRYIGSLTYYEVMEEIANNGYEIKFVEILQKQLQKREFCSTIDTV